MHTGHHVLRDPDTARPGAFDLDTLQLWKHRMQPVHETPNTAQSAGTVIAADSAKDQPVACSIARIKDRPPAPEAVVPMDQTPVMH